jgi:hypothetical protein
MQVKEQAADDAIKRDASLSALVAPDIPPLSACKFARKWTMLNSYRNWGARPIRAG